MGMLGRRAVARKEHRRLSSETFMLELMPHSWWCRRMLQTQGGLPLAQGAPSGLDTEAELLRGAGTTQGSSCRNTPARRAGSPSFSTRFPPGSQLARPTNGRSRPSRAPLLSKELACFVCFGGRVPTVAVSGLRIGFACSETTGGSLWFRKR